MDGGSRRLVWSAHIGLIAEQQHAVALHDRAAGSEALAEIGAYFVKIRVPRVIGSWHLQTLAMG